MLANGRVYVATDSLYAFDQSDGSLVWQAKLDAATGTTPAVDPLSGQAVVGTNIGTLDAFDTNGTRLWSLQLGVEPIRGTPMIANGVVYIGNMDGQFFALDEATGKTLWQQPIGTGGSPYGVESAPALAGGTVYVNGNDGLLYAFDAASGAKLWTAIVGGGGSPAIANGVIYVPGETESGTRALLVVDANSGAILTTAPVNEFLGTSATVANGIVYFGGNEGLFAYTTG
jgi:outer membrane protein assembly factor BamB